MLHARLLSTDRTDRVEGKERPGHDVNVVATDAARTVAVVVESREQIATKIRSARGRGGGGEKRRG